MMIFLSLQRNKGRAGRNLKYFKNTLAKLK